MRPPRIARELFWPVIIALSVTAFLMFVAFRLVSLDNDLERANQRADENASALADVAAANRANAEKLEDNGLEPAVDPEDAEEPVEPIDPDDTAAEISQGDIALAVQAFCTDTGRCKGEPGDDASVTLAQVTAAIGRYCDAAGECEGSVGDRGPRGPAGPPPTQEAILAAVTSYCSGGACRGPQGEPGVDGQDGSMGEPGRPPTPEEIAQAVANYCESRNGCQGPVGPQGPQGPQGPPGESTPGPKGDKGEPGRGIQSVSCNADGSWTFTYTDGTSQTVAGPCRAEQPVQPETR